MKFRNVDAHENIGNLIPGSNEVLLDKKNNTLVVGDGETEGGIPLAKKIEPDLKTGDVVGGDYFEIEDDGTDVRHGDATVWDDLVGSLIGRRLSSVAGKVDYNWDENSITMQPGGAITTRNDLLIFNYQYPHACRASGHMKLHAHWEQPNSNKVVWTVRYRIQSNGAAKTTDWTEVEANSEDNSIYTYESGTLNQITELADVDLTGAGISATVQFRLARTDSTATDIEATFIDAHVERDMLGSRAEYAK